MEGERLPRRMLWYKQTLCSIYGCEGLAYPFALTLYTLCHWLDHMLASSPSRPWLITMVKTHCKFYLTGIHPDTSFQPGMRVRPGLASPCTTFMLPRALNHSECMQVFEWGCHEGLEREEADNTLRKISERDKWPWMTRFSVPG